jgi:hypothetical protein
MDLFPEDWSSDFSFPKEVYYEDQSFAELKEDVKVEDVKVKEEVPERPVKKSKIEMNQFSESSVRFWSLAVSISQVMTIFPTRIPDSTIRKKLYFSITKAYCQHFPNQWIPKKKLKTSFHESWNDVKNLIINKKKTKLWEPYSLMAEVPNNTLLVARFKKTWYVMFWSDSFVMTSCPMPEGYSCPKSCPRHMHLRSF